MEKETCIDALAKDYVNILFKKYVEEDGKRYYVGELERTSFANDETGIKLLKEQIDEPYVTAILTVWGENSKKEVE